MVCIKPVENFNIERILAAIVNRMLNAHGSSTPMVLSMIRWIMPRVTTSNFIIKNGIRRWIPFVTHLNDR